MMWGRPVRGSCVTEAAVLAAAFLLLALGAPLVAQPLHYGISPAEIELVPPPGGTASGILVVYNQSERRIRFTVSLEDIFIRPSGTMDVLAPGSVPWSAVALSKVTPAQFDLDPSRTMRVRITVTVPADARGGRYAVIVVSPTPVLQTSVVGGTVSVIVPKLAAKLLVPVHGTEDVHGDIVSMVAAPLPGGKGADVKVVFKNTGNVHVRTTGYLLVLDPAGQQVSKIALPDTLDLPSSMREFKATWAAAVLSPGPYTLRAVVDYGGAALVAGEIAFTARKP